MQKQISSDFFNNCKIKETYFNQCLNIEEMFIEKYLPLFFENLNMKYKVIGFSTNEEKELQHKDIDVYVSNEVDNFTISLKTVRKVNDFFFVETISQVENNKPGWLYYNESTLILYTMLNKDLTPNITYYLTIQEIRKKIKNKTFEKIYAENKTYRTECLLVPVKILKPKRVFNW